MGTSTETFFRPAETGRSRSTLPAPLYNLCRLLLTRCPTQSVFVPIRSMQHLAVIDREEIIFADSLGYAVHDGQGGRLILQSWIVDMKSGRDSLSEPVPVDQVFYTGNGDELQRRLMSEFPPALKRYDERQRGGMGQCLAATVLPFRGQAAQCLVPKGP
jgi:hypothetical protein